MLTRNKDSAIIYLLFWAVYGPLVILRWHSGGTLLELSIILLIGLGIVLLGLLARDYLTQRRKYHSEAVLEAYEDEEEPETQEIAGFENVFKPDFGKVEIDLD